MRAELDSLFDGDRNAWLDVLPHYQRATLEILLERASSPEDAARLWLNASVENTAAFGGMPPKPIYVAELWSHIEALLCEGKGTSERRKSVLAKVAGRSTIVAAVSAQIASSTGHAQVLIAPAVTILLATVSLPIDAWCSGRERAREVQSAQPRPGSTGTERKPSPTDLPP